MRGNSADSTTDARVGRRDPQVARDRHLQARADTDTVYARDDRHRQIADRRIGLAQQGQKGTRLRGGEFLQLMQIGPAEETALAFACEDREAQVVIVAQCQKSIPQLRHYRCRETVRLGRVFHRDAGIGTSRVLDDLGRDPSFAHQPCPRPLTGMTTPFTQLDFSEISIAVTVAHSSGMPGRLAGNPLYISL